MHIFGKSWSHQKCILKMHIFLRDFFTAIQKCVMDSGRPTFLICTVCPKAVLWWFFSTCFSLCHLNVTQQVWQEILILTLQSQLEPNVPYSGKLKENGSPWSQLSRLRGFWLGSWDQLWAETTQYGRVQDAIASFGGIFTCRWTRRVYTMLESKQSECFFVCKKRLVNFVTCISGIFWLRSWRVFTVA